MLILSSLGSLLQFDNMVAAPVDGENYDSRWNPFIEFHSYLEKTFPLV